VAGTGEEHIDWGRASETASGEAAEAGEEQVGDDVVVAAAVVVVVAADAGDDAADADAHADTDAAVGAR